MQIDVISDVICPWCFIGKRHLDTALARLAAEGLAFTVTWRPYQLNPDMPAEGVPRDEYRTRKFGSLQRSRELDANVAQAGQAAGVEFRFDLMSRTPNTVEAHRAIQAAGQHGMQDAVVERLFVAVFQEGADLGEPGMLARLVAEAGLDPGFLAGDAFRAEVLADDLAVRRAGLNGVPSFAMQNHLLFSGAVPVDVMVDRFRRAHEILTARAA